MTPKKKTEEKKPIVEEPETSPEETIEIEVSVEEPGDPTPSPTRKAALEEGELPYTLSSWRGIKKYDCRFCAFDTISGEEAILAHYRASHAPPPPPAPPPSPILRVDRFGNEIRPEQPPEEK